jgi:hypothetical protein
MAAIRPYSMAVAPFGIIVGLGNLKTGLNTLFNNVKTTVTK